MPLNIPRPFHTTNAPKKLPTASTNVLKATLPAKARAAMITHAVLKALNASTPPQSAPWPRPPRVVRPPLVALRLRPLQVAVAVTRSLLPLEVLVRRPRAQVMPQAEHRQWPSVLVVHMALLWSWLPSAEALCSSCEEDRSCSGSYAMSLAWLEIVCLANVVWCNPRPAHQQYRHIWLVDIHSGCLALFLSPYWHSNRHHWSSSIYHHWNNQERRSHPGTCLMMGEVARCPGSSVRSFLIAT